MSSLRDKIDAEIENIRDNIEHLPPAEKLPDLSELELAGVAALLHSFYNGVENVVKQVLTDRGLALPTGESWHKGLLALAYDQKILSATLFESLKLYLAFRHYFSHGYILDLEPERMESLVKDLPGVFEMLNDECAHIQ